MTRSLPMADARRLLGRISEELEASPTREAVAVTRRGKPVMAILSWELYESIVETLEILGDEEMVAALRQGIRDIREGRTFGMDEIEREFAA